MYLGFKFFSFFFPFFFYLHDWIKYATYFDSNKASGVLNQHCKNLMDVLNCQQSEGGIDSPFWMWHIMWSDICLLKCGLNSGYYYF